MHPARFFDRSLSTVQEFILRLGHLVSNSGYSDAYECKCLGELGCDRNDRQIISFPPSFCCHAKAQHSLPLRCRVRLALPALPSCSVDRFRIVPRCAGMLLAHFPLERRLVLFIPSHPTGPPQGSPCILGSFIPMQARAGYLGGIAWCSRRMAGRRRGGRMQPNCLHPNPPSFALSGT